MLSEYRGADWWREEVYWGDKTGVLHITLWGEMPQGPCPHDTPFKREDLKPSHFDCSVVVDDETDEDGDELSYGFRIYRDKCEKGFWATLLDGREMQWPAFLKAASELLSSELDGETLQLAEVE